MLKAELPSDWRRMMSLEVVPCSLGKALKTEDYSPHRLDIPVNSIQLRGSVSSPLPQIELLAHYSCPFSLGPGYQNIANTCLVAGRITAALFLLVFEPRRVLFFFSVGCVITAALGIRLIGNPGIVNCILAFFFEVRCFVLPFPSPF
jgi:hypothetical protein